MSKPPNWQEYRADVDALRTLHGGTHTLASNTVRRSDTLLADLKRQMVNTTTPPFRSGASPVLGNAMRTEWMRTQNNSRAETLSGERERVEKGREKGWRERKNLEKGKRERKNLEIGKRERKLGDREEREKTWR